MKLKCNPKSSDAGVRKGYNLWFRFIPNDVWNLRVQRNVPCNVSHTRNETLHCVITPLLSLSSLDKSERLYFLVFRLFSASSKESEHDQRLRSASIRCALVHADRSPYTAMMTAKHAGASDFSSPVYLTGSGICPRFTFTRRASPF